MSNYEEQYLNSLRYILNNGTWVENERTGVRCLTVPRLLMEIDLKPDTAPLLSTRPSYPVSAIAEIIGYLRRYTWADQFDKIGAKTWYANANRTQAWLENTHRIGENHLGEVYGAALSEDYIYSVLDKICKGVDDRGLKLDWWQPESFERACLRPCLSDHQFSIIGNEVNITSVQRSLDFLCASNYNALGVYFLGMLAAKLSGKQGGSALHVINHAHIYEPHLEGAEELLSRKPVDFKTMFEIEAKIMSPEDILNTDNHARDYFTLEGYKGVAQPKIDFELVP